MSYIALLTFYLIGCIVALSNRETEQSIFRWQFENLWKTLFSRPLGVHSIASDGCCVHVH